MWEKRIWYFYDLYSISKYRKFADICQLFYNDYTYKEVGWLKTREQVDGLFEQVYKKEFTLKNKILILEGRSETPYTIVAVDKDRIVLDRKIMLDYVEVPPEGFDVSNTKMRIVLKPYQDEL